MPSTRELFIQGVGALLARACPNADLARNRDKPKTVSEDGDIIYRDGDPGDPVDEVLSPYRATYEHPVPVQVAVRQNPDTDSTDLDEMLIRIGQEIEADRTLGGLCSWLEASAPQTDALSVEGARAGRWADLEIVGTYDTTNPLT